MKIAVDGVGGVGKTTMLTKLEYGIFDPHTKLTIGVDFFAKDYSILGQDITAQFWDLVGATRFNFLRPISYKGANCLILVCDLTRPITFERIGYFIKMANLADIKSNQIILVGTKADLFYERNVDSGYLLTILEKFKISHFIETSARNNHNIDALFELATGSAMLDKKIINEQDFKVFKEIIREKIQEPLPEPHEKLIRKCWRCGRALFFYEFCDSNNQNYDEERLLELWESPYLQFYCCSCFKELESKKKIKGI